MPFFWCVVDKLFIKVPSFQMTSPALKNVWLRACLLSELWTMIGTSKYGEPFVCIIPINFPDNGASTEKNRHCCRNMASKQEKFPALFKDPPILRVKRWVKDVVLSRGCQSQPGALPRMRKTQTTKTGFW